MSSATKRKHVTREVEAEFKLPEADEKIVKVVGGRGNNLHEVRDHEDQSYLVSMPSKYRKNVWIKRGDFVVVKPIEEGDKVKAEILNILYKDQIKYIKAEKLWPSGFEDSVVSDDLSKLKILEDEDCDSEEHSDDDSDIFKNTNRPVNQECESSEEESEDDSDNAK